MGRQIENPVDGDLGTNKSGALARWTYYAVIIGLGLMLFLVVYLAR